MSSHEHPLVIPGPKAQDMLGIVSLPAPDAPQQNTGVVIVVGGAQYRVGSHRQFVQMARLLAAAGYPVLRFDFPGMGDSPGAPVAFEDSAPHIAAAEEGVAIKPAPILAAFAKLQAQAELVLVEGVGGFRVPLGKSYDTADLARDLALPVILVVGMRLGCINHALLTAEAIQARGLQLAGWVANQVDPAMLRFEQNLEALTERLPAPLLGVTPFQADGNAAGAAAGLRLPE